jgi:tetratricopeptide (TPR) repeat protein
MRNNIALEDLFRLLPDGEELEDLRAALMIAAVPDSEKEWASSSAYATVGRRVVTPPVLERTLRDAEDAIHRRIADTFERLRRASDRFWDEDAGAAALELVALGDEEENRIRPLRALSAHHAALMLSLPLADKNPQILALRRIARVLWHAGELSEAGDYYARSAELARAAGDLRGEVIARTGSGNVMMFQGRFTDAEACYRVALALLGDCNHLELQLERGHLYNNLGGTLMHLDRLDEADEWLSRAQEIWFTLDSPVDLGVWHHNVGLLRCKAGDLEAGRDMLLKGMQLPVPPALRSMIATDLAEMLLASGMVTRAEEIGREAETYALASRSPYHISHMYRCLGTLAAARGDEGGITFYEKALEIASQANHGLAEGEALLSYGVFRAEMGATDEAVALVERAREIFTGLGSAGGVTRAEQALNVIEAPSPIALAPSLPLAATGD